MKEIICGIIGAIFGTISFIYGGWTEAMTTLCAVMLIDYVSGFVVAGIFKNSPKTENGALESRAGFKGLIRKFFILIIVLIACRLDILLGTEYIRNCVIIAFIANEVLSIIENAGLMGIPIPKVITNAIEILKKKGDNEK